MADKLGLDHGRAAIQFPPIMPAKRLAIDPENSADFRLRNGDSGQRLDETPAGFGGLMRRASAYVT
ncbi:hypothetical protein [Mesorhizobium sp. M0622]|uniref:hypothetical protein n=1 Tax=Mesorhizobium sp. M0622 TaxID=2956975 RepID=UPI00333BC48F